jgi:hypothetical protein
MLLALHVNREVQMSTTTASPILDRKSYLDGPVPVRVQIREGLADLARKLDHSRFEVEFRAGHVNRDNVQHLKACDSCRQLLIDAQTMPTFEHRDNTFADHTTSFDFEAVAVGPKFRMRYLNALKWDEMNRIDGKLQPPTSRAMARARGFLWDFTQRQSRTWISAYRDDETFLRRQNGNVIIVVMVPRTVDEEGEWRWVVVQCREEQYSLQTADDLRRFEALTTIRAKASKDAKPRTVLHPLERLQRTYLDLDEARDDAQRWYWECDDLDDYTQQAYPMDPDVLYRATVTSHPGQPMGTIERVKRVTADKGEDA